MENIVNNIAETSANIRTSVNDNIGNKIYRSPWINIRKGIWNNIRNNVTRNIHIPIEQNISLKVDK